MSDHKPSQRRRSSGEIEEIELNLLPFMNLMTLLIPFLLASVQFVTLAVIDSSLPAIGQPDPSKQKDKDEKPPLNLTIGITEEGFTVAGSAAVLGCENGGGDKDETCTAVPLRGDAAYCEETQCRGVPGCRPDAACPDFEALHKLVQQLKEVDEDGDGVPDYEEEQNVIIAPNAEIPYLTIVGVMDATRDYKPDGETEVKDLFPYVVIAGGVK
jgi:biopolymer transport protein TolR